MLCCRRYMRRRRAALDNERKWESSLASIASGTAVPVDEESQILQWSHVELLGRLHEGTVGKLFLAKLVSETDEAPRLVVRRVDSHLLTRITVEKLLADEAILMKLVHPHLLPHVSLVTDGSLTWGIIMPHERRTLAKLLARASMHEGTADSLREVALHLLADMAAAVAHLHANGVLHLGLRPANVLLDARMQVKLTDYGRQSLVAEHLLDKEIESLATAGVDARYLYYPPEVILQRSQRQRPTAASPAHNAVWCEAVDYWALGCIIARVLTLRPVCAGIEGASTLSPHDLALYLSSTGAGPADGMDDSPSGIVEVVEQCTTIEPHNRLEADEIVRKLYNLHARRFSSAARTSVVESIDRTTAQARHVATRTSHSMPTAHSLPAPSADDKDDHDGSNASSKASGGPSASGSPLGSPCRKEADTFEKGFSDEATDAGRARPARLPPRGGHHSLPSPARLPSSAPEENAGIAQPSARLALSRPGCVPQLQISTGAGKARPARLPARKASSAVATSCPVEEPAGAAGLADAIGRDSVQAYYGNESPAPVLVESEKVEDQSDRVRI